MNLDRLLDAAAHTLDDRSGRGVATRRLQEEHELIAADARHEITRSQVPRKPGGHRAEHLVASRVAQCIVHELETVEVNEGNSEELPFTERLRDCPPGAIGEQPPVRKAGEGIVVSLTLEPAYILSIGTPFPEHANGIPRPP